MPNNDNAGHSWQTKAPAQRHSQLASAAEAQRRTTSPLDFRRPDRIAKSQLRAIHQVHENFVRSLASSLSAYLRTHLLVNLVSVEQLSYVEFMECLPTPTCIASLGLKPSDGNRSEEHTSELQSQSNLVCRLLLEKKKNNKLSHLLQMST